MKIGIVSVVAGCLGMLLLTTPVTAQNIPKAKKAQKPLSPPVGVLPADMTAEAAEVVWLYHHNSTTEGILHYVNNSHVDFKLSVDDVNYLKDIGVPTEVVFAMLRGPQARENVVNLRNHEPVWPAPKPVKKVEEPQPALENIEYRQNEQLDATSETNSAVKSYSPSDTTPASQPASPAPSNASRPSAPTKASGSKAP